jgi:putative transposase
MVSCAGNSRLSQPAICSGDQSRSNLLATSCWSDGCVASRQRLGRRARSQARISRRRPIAVGSTMAVDFPADGRRGSSKLHACNDDGTIGHRCIDHGNLAARQVQSHVASLGSRQPIHQRGVPTAPGDQGLACSSGNCWDNAAMESFFSSRRTERTARTLYHTRDQAKADVFDYIERFYNPRRRHSTLGYLSPMAFERQAE